MSIRCQWSAPTAHTSGRPARPGDLTGYELSMRVEGAPDFTVIAEPGEEATEFVVDATDPGQYEFQLVALASNGTRSAPASGSIVIADTTPLVAPELQVSLT